MDITEVFEGTDSKINKIIAIIEKIDKIDHSINVIKYNDELVTTVPELLKTLGAGKEAAIAELKTL